MTDLEDRVRDALLARAGSSPRVRTRGSGRGQGRAPRHPAAGGRPRRQRWLTRFTPLAAAAAVLVYRARTVHLRGDRRLRWSPARGDAGARRRTAGSPGWTAPSPACTKKIPVSGVQISAKVTVNGSPPRGRAYRKNQYPQRKRTSPCARPMTARGSELARVPPRPRQLVRVDRPSHRLPLRTATSSERDRGRRSPPCRRSWRTARGSGSRAYGRGFPYAAWWLAYPQGISATLVFRDAAGRVVKEIAEPYPPASALRHPVPLTPLSPVWGAPRPCQQARVQQVTDGIKVWTFIGFTVPQPVQPYHALHPLSARSRLGTRRRASRHLHHPRHASAIFALYPTSRVHRSPAPLRRARTKYTTSHELSLPFLSYPQLGHAGLPQRGGTRGRRPARARQPLAERAAAPRHRSPVGSWERWRGARCRSG